MRKHTGEATRGWGINADLLGSQREQGTTVSEKNRKGKSIGVGGAGERQGIKNKQRNGSKEGEITITR